MLKLLSKVFKKPEFIAFCALIFVAGCSKTKVVIDGDREDVISLNPLLKADSTIKNQPIVLPTAVTNTTWSQPFGESDGSLRPLAYKGMGNVLWKVSIGSGSSNSHRLIARPIFVNQKIYTLDAQNALIAFDAETRKKLWTTTLVPKGFGASQALGGGICFGDGCIFSTSGFGEVRAYDAESGTLKWTESTNAPIRIAPVYHKGKVYIITVENQLEVRAAHSGQLLWSHNGMTENAGLLGGAGPSVSDDIVIVPYASGELFALNTHNGQVLWQENVSSNITLSSLGTIAHIHAQPIIDKGLVFVMSHSGVLSALRLQTGEKVWSREVGGVQTPAFAGSSLFVLTDHHQIANVTRDQGKVRWVQEIPKYVDPKKTQDKIFWSGPLLGDGFLYCVGTHKKAVAIDVQTGTITKTFDLPAPSKLPPQIVQGVLYVLCDNGTLVAFD